MCAVAQGEMLTHTNVDWFFTDACGHIFRGSWKEREGKSEVDVGGLPGCGSAIAALEARRDKTRALKQGMMQQLLAGRIRLI